MITINKKYIFLRIIRIFFESFYIIFASSLIFELKNYDPIFFLLLGSFIFHWIHIISSIYIIGVCYKKLNHSFSSSIHLKIWLDSFYMSKVKFNTFIIYSIFNIIISFYLFLIPNRSTYDFFPLSLVILIIFVSSFVKLGSILLIGLLVLFYRIIDTRRNNTRTILIEFEPSIIRNAESSEDKCGICLEDKNIEWGELKCHHRFHYECVLPWMRDHNSCPICREPS